jgi:hypothetical protein
MNALARTGKKRKACLRVKGGAWRVKSGEGDFAEALLQMDFARSMGGEIPDDRRRIMRKL